VSATTTDFPSELIPTSSGWLSSLSTPKNRPFLSLKKKKTILSLKKKTNLSLKKDHKFAFKKYNKFVFEKRKQICR
jgi:hypothetical protein